MTVQELHKHVGLEIKIARLRRGLTTVQLAELIKGHPGHISSIETGKRGPQLKTLMKIADALDIEMKSLLP